MTDDDNRIQVRIRTGTSTRRPEPLPMDWNNNHHWYNNYQQSPIMLDFFHNPLDPMNDITMSIAFIRSMDEDNSLRRNPNVVLDIERRNCEESDIGNECSVCQSNFQQGDKVSTLDDCQHTFHYDCISEWGKYKADCPVCRQPILVLDDE